MSLENLLHIMQQLRQECPWDKKQTPESLTRYAIEEAYEVEDAVRSGNINHIKSELGDLLLQVVFQSQMYSEQKQFNFDDVINTLIEKLVRRHPHVFDKAQYKNISDEEVKQLWDSIKQQEKTTSSRLADIKHAPALNQADEIQKNVAKVGFDFENVEQTIGKFEEEWQEFAHAMAHQTTKEIEDEFGDCLFSLVNIGRKINISSETALLGTIHKFRTRFSYIEQHATKPLEEMTLEEMDTLWCEAKQIEKKS